MEGFEGSSVVVAVEAEEEGLARLGCASSSEQWEVLEATLSVPPHCSEGKESWGSHEGEGRALPLVHLLI